MGKNGDHSNYSNEDYEKDRTSAENLNTAGTADVAINKKEKRKQPPTRKVIAFAQLLLLLTIVIGIPTLIIVSNPGFLDHFRSVEKFDAWISEYTGIGLIIYVICQVMQIIISVLPGQIIQIAGGYIFGFPLTFIASLIGATVGTMITFFLAKLLGKNAVEVICGEERFHKYQAIMSTSRARKVIFLLYLIPGLPKDVVSYAAGVSEMNPLEFLFLSLMGRTPAMTISILFGVMLDSDNYVSAVILAIVVLVIFSICIMRRKQISVFLERGKTEFSERKAEFHEKNDMHKNDH